MNKIHAVVLIFLAVLTTILIAACDTKEDAEYPAITVTLPMPGSIFENGDTIRFHALFSDNTKLTSLEVILLDQDNKPMLSAISRIPEGNPFTWLGDYCINDPMLPNGVYQLRFRTSDGLNVSNHFVEIQIHELAREMLYPLIVTHPEQDKWTAYRLTSKNTWQEFYSQTGDYCGSAVNSPASQFYICGISLSNLTAVHLPDGIPLWNIKPVFNQSMRWFESISFTYPQLYVSCAEGNIRGYDKTGNEIYKSQTYATAVPKLSVTTRNMVIGTFKDSFSTDRFLLAFHNPGGLMLNSKYIQGDVTGILNTTADKVLVFSNSNGEGEISLYNGTDNTLILLHPFSEGIFGEVAALDTDNYLITSSAGLYRYQLSNNSLTLFVAGMVYGNIACDNTSQRIYACSKNTMSVYTFPFPDLLETYPLPDSAIDLHLVFNK